MMRRWLAQPLNVHRAPPWATEYERTASVQWQEGVARICNVRHFVYRTRDDFTPAWYDASYDLDALCSVDLVMSRWAGESVAHVFVSFGFADGRYLAVSIETRRRSDQRYSALGGFWRNYGLIYVVADERDLLGVRTDVRRERVCLYRVQMPDEAKRALFAGYLQRVEALNRRPEFYNTLFNNCTTNVLGHARAIAPHLRYDWRILLSGHADDYAYRMGLLDSSTPFECLKARSLIRRPADAQIDEAYSRAIRERLFSIS
uniref:Lnb N-terminal periplasmic domain-containing protein n=1 Tax=Burkholderia sp. (strain CCGE1003) TaxID=640512 RepID=E1THK6_BURSG